MTASDKRWGGEYRDGLSAAVHIHASRVMLLALVVLASGASDGAGAVAPSSVERGFAQLAADCAPNVHLATLRGLVRTESSWNPYAIGVVGGRLARQPTTHQEAVATARDLAARGYNFSMGLVQVNHANLAAYGESIETVLEPCRNLQAGAAILMRCYQRAQLRVADDASALRAALSCYYSGNFTRGLRPDAPGRTSYVERVLANADTATVATPIAVVPTAPPVPSSGVKAGSGVADHVAFAKAGRPAVVGRPSWPAWMVFVDDAIKQPGGMVFGSAGMGPVREPAAAVPARSDDSLVRISP